MPDPTSHTAAAVAAGASAAAGTFLGVEYQILGIALLGAAVSHIWLPRMLFFREMLPSIFGSFTMGVVAAKLFAGAVIATVIRIMPWLEGSVNPEGLQSAMAIAFAVAFMSQKLMPFFLSKVSNPT